MSNVNNFIEKNFNKKKILLPYQFWYPHINVYKDKMNVGKYNIYKNELENNLSNKKKAIIYIHIPFCNSKCTYCDFEKTYVYGEIDLYIDCLLFEMEEYAKCAYVKSLDIDSIYIGGGTPTILTSDQMNRIIIETKRIFRITQYVSINIESSPNTLRDEMIDCFSQNNVDRISMGVQSFDEQVRKAFKISSKLEDVFKSINLANSKKIDISIDLMYGYEINIQKEISRINTDIDIAAALDIASVEFNLLYPSTMIYKKLGLNFDTKDIVSIMMFAFEKMKQVGFEKISDVTYRKKANARFILDNAYYGNSDGIPDCIAIGAGARGYLNGYRYINVTYSRYIKGEMAILCLKKLTKEEQKKLKIIGFPKRLKLSKEFYCDSYLRMVFQDQIKELMYYNILIDGENTYNVSEAAQCYIDNIFFYLLDHECQNALVNNHLIYYFS